MVRILTGWFRNLIRFPRTQSNKDIPAERAAKIERRHCGERLVFVGGSPRSGTTLLQQMLDSHCDIYGGTEFDSIPNIAFLWRSLVVGLESGRTTAFCTRQQIDDAVSAMIESLLLPVADRANSRLMSEKTPANVIVFKDLLELLPGCRAIHIVRDPRAVISSMLKVGERFRNFGDNAPEFTENLHAAIQLTRTSLEAGFTAAKLFPERVLTLKYERLVEEPYETAQAICGFLEVAFDRQMLQPDLSKNRTWDEVARLDKGYWYDPAVGLSRPIEAARASSWKDALAPSHLEAINTAFRDLEELTALGYKFA
jgi:hypothetical protein